MIYVHDWHKDIDSWGWRILALFHDDERGWGVFDVLCGTDECHAASGIEGFKAVVYNGGDVEMEKTIRRFEHLIDWCPTEDSARTLHIDALKRNF